MGTQSRRATPWDYSTQRSPIEDFIRDNFINDYDTHHIDLSDTNESIIINSYLPKHCPYCGSILFINYGKTKNLIHRYKCTECKRTFTPITNTLFQDHKISVVKWIEYLRNLIQYLSINTMSWNNKNAYTTSRYWLEKVFLLIKDYQDDIILSGTIWLDETFYKLRSDQLIYDKNGNLLRGLSRNQMCIGVACTCTQCICLYECNGKPSEEETFDTFKSHISKNSLLLHDKENSHTKLINELELSDRSYDSRILKKLDANKNPLKRINDLHNLLKQFLDAHSGFKRDHLQDFLNLFTFIMNPPSEKLEKIKFLLNRSFQVHKTLKYRDFYK